MRAASLVVAGVVAYLVFLVAQMPAAFAVARWHRNDGVALTDVTGSIWEGTARATVKLPVGTLALDRLEWSWRPGALLGGALAWDVRARAPALEARATMARTFGGNEARDVEAKADAAIAATIVPLAGTLRPQGALQVVSPRLAWNDAGVRGEAVGTWSAARIAFPEPRTLGSYRAKLEGSGGPLKVTLTTDEGVLRLAGQGQVDALGRGEFAGTAAASGPGAEGLAPLLDLLGPRRPDGARELRWRSP